MGKRLLKIDEGLVLVEKVPGIINTSIHMMFVFTDLAVFWLDENQKVIYKTIAKPWDFYHASSSPAQYVFETHEDHFDQWQIGDRIEFHEAK